MLLIRNPTAETADPRSVEIGGVVASFPVERDGTGRNAAETTVVGAARVTLVGWRVLVP